jgi:hypothetical protein
MTLFAANSYLVKGIVVRGWDLIVVENGLKWVTEEVG